MRGKAKQREVVETFVAWFAPDQPPPRKNAVRGFAQDLLDIAGDEPITDEHLDELVKIYRKRFAGPRTIIDARHMGEQMRRWREERAKGRVDITAPPPASEPPGAPAATGGARGSRPPRLAWDTLPDSSPPPEEDDDADLGSDLAQVAAAARAAQVHTMPGTGGPAKEVSSAAGPAPPQRAAATFTLPGVGDEVGAPPQAALEIDFGESGEASPVPRTNTLPGLGRAIAEAKKRPSGKKKRIVGPTLPGMGIAKALGDADEEAGGRPGIFRGTIPGMGKAVAKPQDDEGQQDRGGERPPGSRPPAAQQARAGSQPPGRAEGGSTQPGVGGRAGSAPPRANETTSGRTQPGVSRPPDGIPPAPPLPSGVHNPLAEAAGDDDLHLRPGGSAFGPATTSGAPPRSEPPPAGTASVPPGASPSMPPSPSLPPRPSYRPMIPAPPPTVLERIADAVGLTGTPVERMRAKLVGIAIAAILLMLLIMSGRNCLRKNPAGSRGTLADPPPSQAK
ncbi:MAG: hypothetical protein JRI68_13945 [Deltaproteobacteria bacterium]|nr:hypothetical protein [Deltaproteobacteria bacterium]